MTQVADYVLISALVVLVLALLTSLVVLASGRRATQRRVRTTAMDDVSEKDDQAASGGAAETAAAVGGSSTTTTATAVLDPDEEANTTTVRADSTTPKTTLNMGSLATGFTVVSLVLLTGYIVMRGVISGRVPLSNQHEFAVAFVWGIVLAYLIVQWRIKAPVLSVVVLPVAALLLLYATQIDTTIKPLMPALQNNVLLSLHVGFAILSYGAACVSFGAAVLYLLYPKLKFKMPRERLDEIGYKGAVVTFPLMTIMILMGSLWANVAWGRYWGWDPKETAALVTWLLYAAYLHARVVAGWRGKRSAWLLILGFAAVLFAYFGNYFFGGLHSYA